MARTEPLLAAVALLVASAAQAAAPLQPGDIVVAGYTYGGSPPGACEDAICVIDSALGNVSPITTSLSPSIGLVADVFVESPGSVLVLGQTGGFPATGTLLQVDVTSGNVATLASGFQSNGSIAAVQGRIFATDGVDILEIDRMTGAVSVFAAGPYAGLDAEPGAHALISSRPIPDEVCFPLWDCHEFVRIPVATGLPAAFEPTFVGQPTRIDAAPDGHRAVFSYSTLFGDNSIRRMGPSGNVTLTGGEDYYSLLGVASDLDGNVLVAGDGSEYEGNPFAGAEIQRWQPSPPSVVASLDTDFGVSALDVTPHRACSDGFDNDGDGKVDWDGGGVGAPDPGCLGEPTRNNEVRPGGCGIGAELAFLGAVFASRRRR